MSWYTNDSLAVAQIPKSGLMSIQDWLTGFDVVKNDDKRLLDCELRVMFVRNPLTRLQSAYSYMVGLKKSGSGFKHGAPLDSFESFIDHILIHDNEHWRPQHICSGGMQTIVHRFEDLSKVFFRYHQRPLTHTNISAREPINDYRLDDIVEFYREDIRLWMGAEI